ncbi:MAG: O-antigen ligase family protein [Cytophagales bacterium]|nr:O-antigen ligase family protein [Cytophagales bacterium]
MLTRTANIMHQLNLCIMVGLIIVLPFAVDRGLMFPTQSAKYFLFGFTILVAGAFTLVEVILARKHLPVQITPLDFLLAVFFLYIVTRVFIDIERYGLPHRFIELSGLAVFYLVLRRLDHRSFNILLIALLLSGAAQGVFGNLQLYGFFHSHHNMFKITGGFFNPGPYAGFLAIIFPIALVIYLRNKNACSLKPSVSLPSSGSLVKDSEARGFTNFLTKQTITESLIFKYVSLFTIISILLVLPVTRSRAAWLAMAVSSILIFADRYNLKSLIQSKFNTTIKKVALVATMTILLGTVSIGLYVMKQDSVDGRLLIWKVTTNMIKERPVFGFGYDRFKANYLKFQADYFAENSNSKKAVVADNTTRAFNEYLQLTSELGIIGLLLILALGYVIFFSKCKSKEHRWCFAARMSLLAFGLFALFSYPAELLPMKLSMVVYMALIAARQRSVEFNLPNIHYPIRTIRPIAIAGSITGLYIMSLLIKPLHLQYRSNRQWKYAYLTYQMGAYEACLPGYRKVYDHLKYNGDFLVNYGKACSMADEHEKAIEILNRAKGLLPNTIIYTALGDSYKALGQHDHAEQAYLRAAQTLPDRFYPKYLLAKLYDETDQQLKAINMARALLNKEIKIESMAVEEIRKEMEAIVNKLKLDSI